MSKPIEQLTEAEVRSMRDRVFGRWAASDDNWSYCREYWMRPENIFWLRLQLEEEGVDL